MSLDPDVMIEPAAAPDAAARRLPWTRTFYWSVRRELWENRAIYVAPTIAAGVALTGFLISAFTLPRALRGAAVLADPTKHQVFLGPYSSVAFAVLVTGFIVAVLYSLDALHGERRDRSILFWKSLPVSDLIAVLSKAATALIVLPAVLFGVIFAGQVGVLILTTLIGLVNGLDLHPLWSRVDLIFLWTVMANGLVFLALWYAPLCAWLLLVGAWAKRMTFLWAVAPPLAICAIERLALGPKRGFFLPLIGDRLLGGVGEAFSAGGRGKAEMNAWPDFDPVRMYSLPSLWIGLLFAAAFLAAAVWLRRSRAPL